MSDGLCRALGYNGIRRRERFVRLEDEAREVLGLSACPAVASSQESNTGTRAGNHYICLFSKADTQFVFSEGLGQDSGHGSTAVHSGAALAVQDRLSHVSNRKDRDVGYAMPPDQGREKASRKQSRLLESMDEEDLESVEEENSTSVHPLKKKSRHPSELRLLLQDNANRVAKRHVVLLDELSQDIGVTAEESKTSITSRDAVATAGSTDQSTNEQRSVLALCCQLLGKAARGVEMVLGDGGLPGYATTAPSTRARSLSVASDRRGSGSTEGGEPQVR